MWGLMGEIQLGTILVVWANGSPQPLGRQAFGHTGSFVLVTVMMLLLALCMLTVVLAGRVPRLLRLSILLALAIGAGLLVTIVLTDMSGDPQGPWLQLIFSLIAIFLVVQEITRSAAKEKRP
ncbi:hypothetical protein [Actinocrispum sp. NPDC049592]|uniref:hypothetical protein n=1 Tax=Actinocrispum sp. NPDC049592 TaxID=3154835 RepID=UPI00341A905E